MVDGFVGADNTITSLGFSTAELVDQKNNRTGISHYPDGPRCESFLFVVERADRIKRLKKLQEWFIFDPLNLEKRLK